MSMLQGILHVNLTIAAGPDALAQAHQFYVGLLGLKELDRPPETDDGTPGWWIGFPNGQQIHISAVDGASGYNAPSKRHAAFQVENLDELRARLENADVPIEDSDQQPAGGRRFLARDLWGNRLEFVEFY